MLNESVVITDKLALSLIYDEKPFTNKEYLNLVERESISSFNNLLDNLRNLQCDNVIENLYKFGCKTGKNLYLALSKMTSENALYFSEVNNISVFDILFYRDIDFPISSKNVENMSNPSGFLLLKKPNVMPQDLYIEGMKKLIDDWIIKYEKNIRNKISKGTISLIYSTKRSNDNDYLELFEYTYDELSKVNPNIMVTFDFMIYNRKFVTLFSNYSFNKHISRDYTVTNHKCFQTKPKDFYEFNKSNNDTVDIFENTIFYTFINQVIEPISHYIDLKINRLVKNSKSYLLNTKQLSDILIHDNYFISEKDLVSILNYKLKLESVVMNLNNSLNGEGLSEKVLQGKNIIGYRPNTVIEQLNNTFLEQSKTPNIDLFENNIDLLTNKYIEYLKYKDKFDIFKKVNYTDRIDFLKRHHSVLYYVLDLKNISFYFNEHELDSAFIDLEEYISLKSTVFRYSHNDYHIYLEEYPFSKETSLKMKCDFKYLN